MTPEQRTVIRIHSSADLLALVPYLLGFVPESSLVVCGLADRRIVVAARMDLPASPADASGLRAGMPTLTGQLSAAGAREVILAGYGDAEHVASAVAIVGTRRTPTWR